MPELDGPKHRGKLMDCATYTRIRRSINKYFCVRLAEFIVELVTEIDSLQTQPIGHCSMKTRELSQDQAGSAGCV